MGPGTYTSMTQVAAETLGIPVERVRFSLGNSDFPPTPPHGGSQTMAAVGSAMRAACLAVQDLLVERATVNVRSPAHNMGKENLDWVGGHLGRKGDSTHRQSYAEIVAAAGGAPVEATVDVARAPEIANKYSMHAFGAVFVELSVDPDLGIARVRRALGAYGAGHIVNPRLARSQCLGGMIGGISMALMEHTSLDPRDGRPVNAHMAEYLLPVNLDIPELDVLFVDETDPHVNPLGVKGLGEISLRYGTGCLECHLPRDGTAHSRTADPDGAPARDLAIREFLRLGVSGVSSSGVPPGGANSATGPEPTFASMALVFPLAS